LDFFKLCHSACQEFSSYYLVFHQWWQYFWCCSGVLLITEVVSLFKTIGIFVIKLCKLEFRLENASYRQPKLNSAEFRGNVEW